VVVPPFALDGREVRSSGIRAAIASGDLATAERLLGRPYAVVGDIDDAGRVTFAMPVALPRNARYKVTVAGAETAELEIASDAVQLAPVPAGVRARVEFQPIHG
jgi:FAD synthase